MFKFKSPQKMSFCENMYSKDNKQNKNNTTHQRHICIKNARKRTAIYAIKGIHANREGKNP